MPEIKICGLARLSDIDYVNEAKPDYIGFVFAESRRKVTPAFAYDMKKALDSSIKSVGVFVNADKDFIADICLKGIIDMVQLHGSENGEFAEVIKSLTGKPIIKAFPIRNRDDSAEAEKFPSDMILCDTWSPNVKGGTGKPFNWDLVKNIRRPFFLAGGLSESNIKEAWEKVKPQCFDVSSGAETDGVKDKSKIINIVNIVRSIN